MKNLIFIFFFAPNMIFINLNLSVISQALSTGDTEKLSEYFDDSVEIAVLDKEDVYSKAEAKKIIQDFFEKNKAKSFSQVHQGTSKSKGSKYCIGNLVAGGNSYRVYIYLKTQGNKYLIQELRIDKE